MEKLPYANSDLSHLAPICGHLHFAGRCAGRRSLEAALACGAQARARPRGTPGIQPPFRRVPEPPRWRNGPGMRRDGGRKDPPGALEPSGGLPAEISARKGSVSTRRGAREQRCFAIRTPALLREGSEQSGRTRAPAPRKRATAILAPGRPRRSRALVLRTLGVRAPRRV